MQTALDSYVVLLIKVIANLCRTQVIIDINKILEADMDYNTLFIEPEGNIDPKERQNASYLRREFAPAKEIKTASLTITACGLYVAYINGRAVGNQVFMPGCTYYHKRLQLQKYDVTSLVTSGSNAIGVVLGDGWYRGEIGVTSKRNYYGEKTKLFVVLEIKYTDDTTEKIITDENWKATQEGPIRHNDLKCGEEYNAEKEMQGWNASGYDDKDWHGVFKSEYSGELVESLGEKILEHERFKPSVIITPDGSTVLDFKQNIFGYVEFTITGKSGQSVRLLHGETLDENKNFTVKNLILPFGGKNKKFQEVNYTLKDGKQKYKPSFSAHGFRYVKLENWTEEVIPENFVSIAVYSDMKQTGTFECSNPLINQLVANTRWSQKGNFLDIPTDCPTRERAGWTGDIAAYCETGTYLMDINKFLSKWLADLAVQQREDGCVHNIVPDTGLFIGHGSAGWADACIIVPFELYKVYGDESILEKQYDSMTKWMEFMFRRAQKTSKFKLFKKNPYKQYTIDTGFHFGEWLEPGSSMLLDSLKAMIIADAEVATAYYAYVSKLMAEIAEVLNIKEDADKYRELYENIKKAYRYNFTKEGIIKSKRQCRYVRPIALDLLSENDKVKNAKILNDKIIQNEYRIGTGFLTTQFVLSVLTEYGYKETAYKMIENTKNPSWLYNVEKGATTILEDWKGIGEDGKPKNSFNHYAFGTVVKWLFNTVAGISSMKTGYKKVLIKPIPGGSLTYAKCSFESPMGLIKSEWNIISDTFELKVAMPVSGEIHMPDGEIHMVEKGDYIFSCSI